MVEPPELRRPSLSSSSDGGHSAQSQRTNTLIITKVPPALLSQAVTPSLKEFFENYGKIEAWVPLKSFERVVVVYEHEEHAEQAKLGLDYTLVEGFGPSGASTSSSNTILRVYRGPPTPLETLRDRHYRNTLPVPTTDRNFLISPPGSPPVGWEQAREDPPNMDTLADDLARALDQLTYSRFDDDSEHGESEGGDLLDEGDSHTAPQSASRMSIPQSPRDTLIIPHRRTESGSLPSVMVSDTDAVKPMQASRNGLSLEQAFAIQRRTPTSRPPGPISQVKATVESMQESAFQPSGPRIDRTPRPPLAG